MSTINRLSSVDVLQPSDQIPVWDSSNGDTRKASMCTLLAFVESYFADPDYSTRIVAPSVDYFNVDIGATGDSIWMIVNPTLNFTNGAITLPPASSAVNDQEITVVFTSSVSTFVITSAGATVLGAPTQINGYDSFKVRYNASQLTWYNIGTTGSGSGSGVSQIVREDFTGDGTTTTFALLNIPSALGNELQIFIDGVYQERAGYTVSGVNIIFSEAPPVLSNIEVLGWAVSIGAETSSNLVSYTPAGTGAVLTTVQAKLRESVSVKDFGAVGDGVTDDTAAIQAAIDAASADNGRTVVFDAKVYRIASTINITNNGTILNGRGCEWDFYGTGVALDFVPIGGVTYPVSCQIKDITIRVRTASTGTGIRVRTSYSLFHNVGVVLYVAATNARGIMLVGDEVNGTGPYYNQFFNTIVQSTSLGLDHTGISFVASAPLYRSPNANTFYGGRVGQCSRNYIIKGSGNTFFNPTSENVAITGTAFEFEADTTVNCVQNQIFGAYIENAQTGFLFNTDATACSVYSPYVTGATTPYNDLGTDNTIVDASIPAVLPFGVNPNGNLSSNSNVLDAYVEGTWVPTLVGATTPGDYTVTTTSAKYTLIGQQMTVTAGMSIVIITPGTGVLTFSGLPLPKDSDEFITGSVTLSGATLHASTRSLSVGSTTFGTQSDFVIYQSRTGLTLLELDCADVSGSFFASVAFTYTVLN